MAGRGLETKKRSLYISPWLYCCDFPVPHINRGNVAKHTMKVLLFGLGSIGQRHARNLRVLRPNAEIVCVDPDDSISLHTDWRAALADHPGADCAIIASPTPAHLDQAIALRVLSIPFYVEKPIGTPDQAEQWTRLDNGFRCAVGYQYRFYSGFNA